MTTGLRVDSEFRPTGTINLSNGVGASGQVLASTVTGTQWVTPSGGGTIGGSIANQQIAVGTASNTIGGNSKFIWTPQSGFQVGNASDTQGNVITINRPSTAPGKFIIKQNNTTEFSIVTGGGTTISTEANNLVLTDNSSANVGIGDTSPSSKLSVDGGVQIANDTDSATLSKVGTFRYRTSTTGSFDYSHVDMCMQVDEAAALTAYEWVNVVTNRWEN